uniref:Uncharacterized protein n=1 Tax=Amphimedon queenslandica TaxID=400682 RepID=A0A1X7V8E8_AMPQE
LPFKKTNSFLKQINSIITQKSKSKWKDKKGHNTICSHSHTLTSPSKNKLTKRSPFIQK